MRVVLLFSGGLDSTTALYWLRNQGHDVHGLSVRYGQRHQKELEAAASIAAINKMPWQLIDLSPLQSLLGGSSQTDLQIEVPEGHYTEDSMRATVVPNRNMILLALAIAWAVREKMEAVAYAAHSGDHTIYPDCRPEFIQKMREAASLCDWHDVALLSPFEASTKTDIVRKGFELDVPFHLTWSCYKGGVKHCGKCGTCVERKEAFYLSGIPDPTIYE